MDSREVFDNHKEGIEDLQGRVHAHRVFLLYICRRFCNKAELEFIRDATELRARVGPQEDAPKHYAQGYKNETELIAKRLVGSS